MIAALRPGGRLLLEEVDFFPVQTSRSALYVDFMPALTGTIVAASGRDCLWARALPALVAERGLVGVDGEGDLALLRGGSPIAEFFKLTGDQMRDRVIASRALSPERFDAGMALLDDPKFWAFAGAGIAVWGKRPNGNSSHHSVTYPIRFVIRSSALPGRSPRPLAGEAKTKPVAAFSRSWKGL
jgi:hypothetical protein